MSKDILSMIENKIIDFLRFALQPWYGLHFLEKTVTINHPLYMFQFRTKTYYTFEQAVILLFRILCLKEYSKELLIISTVYMRRISMFISSKYKIKNVFTPYTITTVFFFCLLLASKYYMDDPISNKDLHQLVFYNVISLQMFNYFEVEILEIIDYNLYVSFEEYTLYENMLK